MFGHDRRPAWQWRKPTSWEIVSIVIGFFFVLEWLNEYTLATAAYAASLKQFGVCHNPVSGLETRESFPDECAKAERDVLYWPLVVSFFTTLNGIRLRLLNELRSLLDSWVTRLFLVTVVLPPVFIACMRVYAAVETGAWKTWSPMRRRARSRSSQIADPIAINEDHETYVLVRPETRAMLAGGGGTDAYHSNHIERRVSPFP